MMAKPWPLVGEDKGVTTLTSGRREGAAHDPLHVAEFNEAAAVDVDELKETIELFLLPLSEHVKPPGCCRFVSHQGEQVSRNIPLELERINCLRS